MIITTSKKTHNGPKNFNPSTLMNYTLPLSYCKKAYKPFQPQQNLSKGKPNQTFLLPIILTYYFPNKNKKKD
jgi:hypothetical protein